MRSKKKTNRLDLGLAISGATLGPGQRRTHREIAAYCDCSAQAIAQIEAKALHTLRRRIRRVIGDTGLEDLMAYLDEDSPQSVEAILEAAGQALHEKKMESENF